MTTVTVGVKALNEETHIAMALESAVEAVGPFGGEVVLADSGSTDRTVEIARRFPIRIFQLANGAERSCGVGAQLAFQHAQGEYFYILDGDMKLVPGFLAAGIGHLEANPDIAGVGGRINERNTEGEEFQIRAKGSQTHIDWRPGIVDRLDCGGLYRVAAIREAGYFADRNLHAFEEFELGARLLSLGWKLARIDHDAADHYGHTTGSYRLLWRRIRSRYAEGPGEVVRAAIGNRHLAIVLRRLAHVRNGIVVVVWWLVLLVAAAAWPLVGLLLLILPIVLLSMRRGSLKLGLYSLTSWNVTAWGLLAGLFRRRVPPTLPIASIKLTD